MLLIELSSKYNFPLQHIGYKFVNEDIKVKVSQFTQNPQFKQSQGFYLSFLMARIVLIAKQFIQKKTKIEKKNWQFPQYLVKDIDEAKALLNQMNGQATQTEIEMGISFLDNLSSSREITISKKSYVRMLMLQLDGIQLQ